MTVVTGFGQQQIQRRVHARLVAGRRVAPLKYTRLLPK